MTPAAIIEKAAADGVRLSLSASGSIKVTGGTEAVNRWLSVIRETKPEIIEALQEKALPNYHDAVAAEAIPETPKPKSPLSPELETLVRKAAVHYECSPGELELMLEDARNDPEGALACYQRPDTEINAVPDPAAEARRQRVLTMLEQNPVIRYALTADAESDPDEVIVTLAIRDFAECELRILQDKYDAFLLLRLIEDTGGPFTRVKDMT